VNKTIITVLLCLLLSVSCAPHKNSTFTAELETNTLILNSQPFFIKGINWSYSPIGTNYEYSLWAQPEKTIKAALDYDMALLQNMGINTLRIYSGMPSKWITYIYDNYGIYTVINHSFGRYGVMLNGTWNPYTDYGDSLTKEVLLEEVKAFANQYKNTRGLLMFLLGNENNYGLFWEGGETEDIPTETSKYDQKAIDLYLLFNEAALAMKKLDTTHKIALCNGDLKYLDLIVEHCPDVDVLGINIYRGASFTGAFDDIKTKSDKPVMFTEFGGDAFNSIKMEEDQSAHAEYLLSNWKEIYENTAGLGKAENSIGGFTFQWSDGWWKTGQTINLDKHDSTASWTNGGYYHDFVKGKPNMNEEWFGICAKGKTLENGTYPLYPRAAYYILQEVNKLNPYHKDLTPEQLNDKFSKIKISEAREKAKLQPR